MYQYKLRDVGHQVIIMYSNDKETDGEEMPLVELHDMGQSKAERDAGHTRPALLEGMTLLEHLANPITNAPPYTLVQAGEIVLGQNSYVDNPDEPVPFYNVMTSQGKAIAKVLGNDTFARNLERHLNRDR